MDDSTNAAESREKVPVTEGDRRVNKGQKKRLQNTQRGHFQAKRTHTDANACVGMAPPISILEKHDATNCGDSETRNLSSGDSAVELNAAENVDECAAIADRGNGASIEKPQSSYAGSSGEEADIDTCSGGSDEATGRRLHKRRAAVVCQDGHVPPAVDQHEGDCMVASKLLTLWNARPVAGTMMAVVGKEVARDEGAKAVTTIIC